MCSKVRTLCDLLYNVHLCAGVLHDKVLHDKVLHDKVLHDKVHMQLYSLCITALCYLMNKSSINLIRR